MISWIRQMLIKHRELISYLFFGVLTTAVNWAVYYPLVNVADWPAASSKALAWVIAVLFAFLTNKPFVYRSLDWSFRTAFPEFVKFIGCRIGSGLLEIFFIFFTVDLIHWDKNIMNIVVSVFVVLINYVGGKILFHTKKHQ